MSKTKSEKSPKKGEKSIIIIIIFNKKSKDRSSIAPQKANVN